MLSKIQLQVMGPVAIHTWEGEDPAGRRSLSLRGESTKSTLSSSARRRLPPARLFVPDASGRLTGTYSKFFADAGVARSPAAAVGVGVAGCTGLSVDGLPMQRNSERTLKMESCAR